MLVLFFKCLYYIISWICNKFIYLFVCVDFVLYKFIFWLKFFFKKFLYWTYELNFCFIVYYLYHLIYDYLSIYDYYHDVFGFLIIVIIHQALSKELSLMNLCENITFESAIQEICHSILSVLRKNVTGFTLLYTYY